MKANGLGNAHLSPYPAGRDGVASSVRFFWPAATDNLAMPCSTGGRTSVTVASRLMLETARKWEMLGQFVREFRARVRFTFCLFSKIPLSPVAYCCLQMRRRERELETTQRQMLQERRTALGRGNGNGDSWSQDNNIGGEGTRPGAEAYVARDADGGEPYAPAEWETDETLEAYIVGDGM